MSKFAAMILAASLIAGAAELSTKKGGNMSLLVVKEAFPMQGGLPIKVDRQTIRAVGVGGAASEVDEAINQAAIDAVTGK